MTLREAVDRYVAWQRQHGAKFRSSAQALDTFCRQVGEDRGCDTVGASMKSTASLPARGRSREHVP